MGFLSGMRLRLGFWLPFFDPHQVNYGLLLPILLYCTDPLGEPMLGPLSDGPKMQELLHTAYHDIQLVIPAIREVWMPQRVAEARRQA
jgi:uncharacterized protein